MKKLKLLKNKLLLFLCLLSIINLKAQINSASTTATAFDTIFDKTGKKYSLNALRLNQGNNPDPNALATPATSCQAGYFKLFFAPSFGLATPLQINMRAIICQMFSDVSCLVKSPLSSACVANSNTASVNVYIDAATGPGQLGNATSLYAVPLSLIPTILDNLTWITIVSGVDGYTNVAPPVTVVGMGSGFYHMLVNIDVTAGWNLNTSSNIAPATQPDLYAVALHEVTHGLGFNTLMGTYGTTIAPSSTITSVFGFPTQFFSRYDRFLTNKNGVPLLSTTSPLCSMTSLTLTSPTQVVDIAPSVCTASPGFYVNNTVCNTSAFYASPTQTVPVYTPNCFEAGSSLSHFEDQCYPTPMTAYGNDAYFLMSNFYGTLPGNVIKRFLNEEEKTVLCDLGYSVSAQYTSPYAGAAYTYTSGACSGPNVWGINDGFIGSSYQYIIAGTSISIPISAIIANDAPTVVNADCVSFVYNYGMNLSVSAGSIIVSYPPGPITYCGPILLRYVPKDAAGTMGNITYIYIYAPCSNCGPPSPCNMVQNGGFENIVVSSTVTQNCGFATGGKVNCWDFYSVNNPTPDLINRFCGGSPLQLGSVQLSPLADTWNGTPNDKCIGLYIQTGSAVVPPTQVQEENLKTTLNNPLVPTNTYVVSFWAYNISSTSINPNAKPVVFTLASAPNTGVIASTNSVYPQGLNEVANFTLASSDVNKWKYYTSTFTFTGTVNHNCFIMGSDFFKTQAITTSPGIYKDYVVVDDFSLLPIGQVPVITLPNNICNGNSITNLGQYANISGVFTGTGVTNTGGIYDFNTSNTLAPGNYPIVFSYTNNLGCANTFVQIVGVGGANASSVSCTNNNYTLNATGFLPNTTYTWLPSGQTTPSIAVNPTSSTIYTLIAANGTICTNSYTTAINIYPTPTINPIPPFCVSGSSTASGTLQTYIGTGTPVNGNFLGINIVNGNCGGSICSFISPTPPAGIYNYTYTLPSNTTTGFYCPVSTTFNVQFTPTFTLNINALPSGTNCINAGQSTTLVATASQSTGVSYTWQPSGQTTPSIVIIPIAGANVYTLTGFNGGCNVTNIYTLNANPTATFTNIPTSWCTYQSIYYLENYLGVGTPTGGTWSGDPNIGTIYTASVGLTAINVNPTLTTIGTHTIYYTYTSPTNSLCNVTSQFTINVNAGFNLNTNINTLYCSNIVGSSASLIATSSPSTGVTYTWQPGNLAGANQTVTPLSATLYTVTANNIAGCTFTNTTLVNVSNACCSSNNYFASNVIAPGLYSGGWAINQNSIIFGNVQFSGEFVIAPNVSITIATGGYLSASRGGMHLYSCGDMWSGIDVQNGGKILLAQDDLIEDAIVAISSTNCTNTSTNQANFDLNIDGAVFNKNYIAIKIANYVQGVTDSPFLIRNNVFSCRNIPFTATTWDNSSTTLPGLRTIIGATNTLNSPYVLNAYTPVNLKAPYTNQPSYAGVYIENSGTTANPTATNPIFTSILIGEKLQSDNGYFNLFDNLMFGIYGLGSNVESQNNTFQNTRRAAIPRLRGGYGIYCVANATTTSNNYLLATHPSTYLNAGRINKFYDCYIGIGLSNMLTADVQYADFKSSQTPLNPPATIFVVSGVIGVSTTSNRLKNYKISNNTMQNLNRGISAQIVNNNLNLAGAPAFGQYLGRVSISTNTIIPKLASTTGGAQARINIGVYAANQLYSGAGSFKEPSTDFRINDNSLTNVWRGVQLYGFNINNYSAVVANNTVSLVQDINTQQQFGVYCVNGYANIINTNNVTGFGITNTLVTGVYNSMNSAPSNPTIALNSIQCNSVTNLFAGFEFASYNGSSFWRNNNMQTNNRGLFLSNAGYIGQQGNTNSASDNKWNGITWNSTNPNTVTDGNSFAYLSPLYVRNSSPYIPNFNVNTSLIVAQSYNGVGALFNNANGPFANCYPTGSGGGCATCRVAMLDSIVTNNITFTTNVAESQEIFKNAAFKDVVNEPALTVVSPTLNTFYATNLTGTRGIYKAIDASFAQGNLVGVATLLAAFTPTTNIENNYKTYYSLLKSYTSNGYLTIVQQLQLAILAHQCPFTDGAIVYDARALYNLVNETVVVYNDNNCTRLGFSFRETNDTSKHISPQESELLGQLITNEKVTKTKFKPIIEYRLYPNPAVNEVAIISNFANEKLEVRITDVNGKLLLSKTLITNDYRADLKLDLLNGIYFVNLTNEQGIKTVKKLVIAK